MTEKERDRLKYLKNRETRLRQVNERLLLKRDEINEKKKVHYQKNKERIAEADKQRRKELREKDIIPFSKNPNFTKEVLEKNTKFRLKEIAKQFGLIRSPKNKPELIQKILDTQEEMF